MTRKDNRAFARDGLLLIVAGALTGLINIVSQSILGRIMPDLEYSMLVSLLGLFYILGVPSITVQVVIARYVAEYKHDNVTDLWVTVYTRARKRIVLSGLVALIAWCFLSPLLKDLFRNAPSETSIILLGVAAFMTLYVPVVRGVLQGAGHFGWLAGSTIGAAAARLVLAVIGVVVVGGVAPVLGAIALSVAVGILIGYWPFRKVFSDTEPIKDFDTSPIYRYLWPVLAGQVGIFLLMYADMILSARFLSGEALAIYGKGAMLSRIVLFLPLPVAVAMFPRAVTSSSLIILKAPLIFTAAVSAGAALFISLFPSVPMQLIYKVNDPAYLSFIARYVWAITPISLVFVISQYLWARDRAKLVLCILPIVLLYIAGLFAFHDSPDQMMILLGCAALLSLVVLALAMMVSTRKQK